MPDLSSLSVRVSATSSVENDPVGGEKGPEEMGGEALLTVPGTFLPPLGRRALPGSVYIFAAPVTASDAPSSGPMTVPSPRLACALRAVELSFSTALGSG